jgi:hypothetical protein
VSASSFTDIEVFGIYMKQLNFDSSSESALNARQLFDGFSADLTVSTVSRTKFVRVDIVCLCF